MMLVILLVLTDIRMCITRAHLRVMLVILLIHLCWTVKTLMNLLPKFIDRSLSTLRVQYVINKNLITPCKIQCPLFILCPFELFFLAHLHEITNFK
jgi:hypothetical protein